MKRNRYDYTQEELRARFDYDPLTGAVYAKDNPYHHRRTKHGDIIKTYGPAPRDGVMIDNIFYSTEALRKAYHAKPSETSRFWSRVNEIRGPHTLWVKQHLFLDASNSRFYWLIPPPDYKRKQLGSTFHTTGAWRITIDGQDWPMTHFIFLYMDNIRVSSRVMYWDGNPNNVRYANLYFQADKQAFDKIGSNNG